VISFRKIWIIAKSLLLSQLRATSTSRSSIRSLIRRPLILGVLDLVVAVAAGGLAYIAATAVLGSSFSSVLTPMIQNVFVILPAIILGIILLMGLVLEVSSGAQFASSDTVNWLPVRAVEYVAASALSLLMYYSVIPVAALSATFSFAIVFGFGSAWVLAALLSLFSVLIATSVLEILRAVLNRFSSTFYKRGGKAAIALRIASGILVLIVFQALFYPSVYERFLGVITSSIGPTWFVPILWASVSVTSFLNGNFAIAGLFALLTIFLAGILFTIAVGARSKYWVPMQPTITISSSVYAPRAGFGSFILNPIELAIARKDMRGLLRRREMIRLLATPFVFLVISFLSSGSAGFSFTIYFGFFIVAFSTLFIAISAIGAEGKAIVNLYQAPLKIRDFVIGKSITPIVFGSIFGVLVYVIVALIVRNDAVQAATFMVAAIGLALEMAFVGTLIGFRFPNFSESPRAQFVSQTGGLIAVPVAAIIGGLSLAPLLITSIFNFGSYYVTIGFASSIAIILIASFVFFKFAEGQAGKLLSQLPI